MPHVLPRMATPLSYVTKEHKKKEKHVQTNELVYIMCKTKSRVVM